MKRHHPITSLLLVAVFAFVLGVATSTAESSDDDNEIPFDIAKIFIALNDTDGDLGIAAFIDGEAWRQLKIFDQNEECAGPLGEWAFASAGADRICH